MTDKEKSQEPWSQPLLNKHDKLKNLTGKSGEKDPNEYDDPRGGHGKGKKKGKGDGGKGRNK